MIKEDIYLKKLGTYIKNIQKINFFKEKKFNTCPFCDCNKFIKYGFYNGIQRYKCKECGKTFSLTTNSLWSYSKKQPEDWLKFLELMLERKTLRLTADRLNMSLGTAFFWRHKVLNSLLSCTMAKTFNKDVYINNAIVTENFKGCKDIIPEKRSRIWVSAVKDIDDKILFTPVFKDLWNMKSYNKLIYSKISDKSYVIDYGDRYTKIMAKKHNVNLKRKARKDDNSVKFFRVYLFRWLTKFCGIATKYLDEYLCWFAIENFKRKIGYMDLMDVIKVNDSFIRSMDIKDKDLNIV